MAVDAVESKAIADQIMTVSRERLGILSLDDMRPVESALRLSAGVKRDR